MKCGPAEMPGHLFSQLNMNGWSDTKTAWILFSKFPNVQLDMLLKVAGVKPCKDRSLKLQQVLVVWFHGFIPNLTELAELAKEVKND